MTMLAFTPVRVCAAIVICAISGVLVAAAPASADPQRIPPRHRAAAQAGIPLPDRGQILSNLYDRLAKAPDATVAGEIASSIETVWLSSGSATVDLLMQRAINLVQQENLDDALALFDRVVEMEPDYPEGWNQRATVFFMKHDYQRAMEDLQRVLAIDPRHYKAVNGMAIILQETGDKAGALRAYRKALALHPHLDTAQQAVQELSREVEGQDI